MVELTFPRKLQGVPHERGEQSGIAGFSLRHLGYVLPGRVAHDTLMGRVAIDRHRTLRSPADHGAIIRATFLPACAKAKVSGQFRIHDLRHTAASLMIRAGYPPKMLQEIMGHASITTTLDLYGHLSPGDMDRYADRLDEAAVAKMRPDEPLDGSDDEAAAS